MTKAAIPAINSGRADLDRVLSALKQNMDAITGQARNAQRLDPLPSTASNAEIIARLNEILARLQ